MTAQLSNQRLEQASFPEEVLDASEKTSTGMVGTQLQTPCKGQMALPCLDTHTG